MAELKDLIVNGQSHLIGDAIYKTHAAGDNSDKLASTAYVKNAIDALPAGSDTKNTTGTTNKANTKLFLAGAETQGDNPVTYSNSNVYIGTDNQLYSLGTAVKTKLTAVSDITKDSAVATAIIESITQNTNGVISPVKKSLPSISVVTSGTGNVVTSVGGSGHVVTALMGTALTSESDPVFSASAAAGITSNDITKWNSAIQPNDPDYKNPDLTAYVKATNTLGTTDGAIIVKDGSATNNRNIKVSSTTITTAVPDSSSTSATIPTSDAVYSAINGALSSSLVYKGTISAYPSPSSPRTGDVWIASTSFTYDSKSYEKGDMFIYNGTTWDVVSGENQAEDKNVTITLNKTYHDDTAANRKKTLATIDGTDIHLTLANEYSESANKDVDGNVISTTYLPKTTYEWNKEIAFGSSGKLCIGKFVMYDSEVMVEINSTTNTTYHGILIIATQNHGTSSGGTLVARVYGDAANTIAPNIYIYNHPANDGLVEVYFSPTSYSKNLIHIQAQALTNRGTVTYNSLAFDVCTSVSAVPAEAVTKPTNALTDNFKKVLTAVSYTGLVTEISLNTQGVISATGTTVSTSAVATKASSGTTVVTGSTATATVLTGVAANGTVTLQKTDGTVDVVTSVSASGSATVVTNVAETGSTLVVTSVSGTTGTISFSHNVTSENLTLSFSPSAFVTSISSGVNTAITGVEITGTASCITGISTATAKVIKSTATPGTAAVLTGVKANGTATVVSSLGTTTITAVGGTVTAFIATN